MPTQGNQSNQRSGSGRGFASMDAERQRQIASQGGRAAHQRGTAHEFSSEEAREAGRKGGQAVSQDRRHMAEIGSKGGQSRGNRGNSTAARNSNNENNNNMGAGR
jgi:uncharacterized protein